MICSCSSRAVPQNLRLGAFWLNFERCPACGRCDGFVLVEGTRTVLTGNPARQHFNHLQQERLQ